MVEHQLVAPAYSYTQLHHVSCSQTRVVFWEEDLHPCKTMTDILAPVECTNWVLSA